MERRKVRHEDLWLISDGGNVADPNSHASRHLAGGADQLFDQNLNTTDTPQFADVKLGTTGYTLGSHGARHNRGGADAIDYKHIVVGFNKSASPTVATSNATVIPQAEITPDTGYSMIFPIWCKVTLGGLATGEAITVTVQADYDDGTSDSISDTLSASGSIDISSLIADGKVITKLWVSAQSSKTTTTATCTVNIIGMQS